MTGVRKCSEPGKQLRKIGKAASNARSKILPASSIFE
jgi:hypothetical protein